MIRFSHNKIKKGTQMTKIILSVNSGIIEVVQKSRDVELEVRDYDIEGYDEDLLEEDADGNEFRRIKL